MPNHSDKNPICVDLDGTLIKTDLLYENFFAAIKASPILLFKVIWWLLGGKSHLKAKLAEAASIDYESIPLNKDVVSYVESQAKAGRDVYLATASHEVHAKAIVERLKLFKGYFATEDKRNLSGKNKAKTLIEKFGDKGFEYLGDSNADLDVWPHCSTAGVVSSSKSFLRRVSKVAKIGNSFRSQHQGRFKSLLRCLRVHQWSKNGLLFVPALSAHKIQDPKLFVKTTLAFIAFSFCASAVYVINDLVDLSSDRNHPEKRHRPLASGDIKINWAPGIVFACLLISALCCRLLNPNFVQILVIYLAITFAYSFYLKRQPIIDVLTLGALYTIRVFAGSQSTEITVSTWLLGFSLFFFFGLAFAKRVAELIRVKPGGSNKASSGRAYIAEDQAVLANLGVGASMVSILILAQYISANDVILLYSHPDQLWLICIVLLYWTARLWFLASRGIVDTDPVIFAIKDKASYLLGFIVLLIGYFAH